MNLKGLIHRELGEGLTEEELASAVGVTVRTIANIIADELQDPAIWETFARYFRIHADFLRSGDPPHSEGLFELTENTDPSPLGPMRKVPLLRWDQIDQMVKSNEPPRVIHAEAMLETDVPGKRTFAMQSERQFHAAHLQRGRNHFRGIPIFPVSLVITCRAGVRTAALRGHCCSSSRKSAGKLFFIHSTLGMKISP